MTKTYLLKVSDKDWDELKRNTPRNKTLNEQLNHFIKIYNKVKARSVNIELEKKHFKGE